MDKLAYVHNQMRMPGALTEAFSVKEASRTAAFHRSFPEYEPTPLAELSALAKTCGVAKIWVKDESKRFGLNAFKVLGGSYCMANYIAKVLGLSEVPTFDRLTAGELREQMVETLGDVTFITTTDGNHGRGVAWAASRLGFRSVVMMPKGSSEYRLARIREAGAQAEITEYNYDDTVRLTAQMAKENDWVLMQDTSWDGYEEIPRWIMQGYMTMAYEAVEQLKDVCPTHIFLQAGVGAMAGALTGFFRSYYGDAPKIVIVESDQAACLYETVKANDGQIHIVGGDLATIMAGLACGEPCGIGWQVLRQGADMFVAAPDEVAATGMRLLGKPTCADPKVVSGESGAVTLGFAATVLRKPEYEKLKQELELDERSRVLCFSTEGDTDPVNYERIMGE